jgi:hypothetical protein
LTESVAASIANSGVGILEGGNNKSQNLIQLTNHKVATSFRDSGNGHQSGVTIAPIGRGHHARNPGECGLEDGLSAKLVGETIHTLLTGDVVKVALFGFEL